MRDVRCMRSTLNLDDAIFLAVKERAGLRSSTAGEVLSDLARSALEARRAGGGMRNGVPLLEAVDDEGVVSPEAVARLRDEA